jgi:hypothetical protein
MSSATKMRSGLTNARSPGAFISVLALLFWDMPTIAAKMKNITAMLGRQEISHIGSLFNLWTLSNFAGYC